LGGIPKSLRTFEDGYQIRIRCNAESASRKGILPEGWRVGAAGEEQKPTKTSNPQKQSLVRLARILVVSAFF
jgi:hypothetical protein